MATIARRCPLEGWENDYNKGVALVVQKVALYDTAKYVILPFTVARQCSFVEMVARGAQPPLWFVSHWWGEPVVDFVACLEQHAQDYGKKDRHGYDQIGGNVDAATPYWVCAYANNQWALGDALTKDPGQTSFHQAMSLAEGTISVLDKDGIVFKRIWCEVFVSLQRQTTNGSCTPRSKAAVRSPQLASPKVTPHVMRTRHVSSNGVRRSSPSPWQPERSASSCRLPTLRCPTTRDTSSTR